MFIEQSVGRRRVVRVAFVLGAIVPCVLLAVFARWRHSSGYRAGLAHESAAHLGVPVAIGAASHPRPGVLRLSDVEVGGAPGKPLISLPRVEVETAGDETRVRLPELACSPGAVGMLADVAREWLCKPARFRRTWVIDVARVTWLLADGGRVPDGGWHLECAAVDGSRGLWVRREPGASDEMRVRIEEGSLVAEGRIDTPLPAPVVAAVFGTAGDWAAVLGPRATVQGRVSASCAGSGSGWTGSVGGVIDRIDLASLAARGPRGLGGEATIAIERLRFDGGRLTDGEFTVVSQGGTVSQELLEGAVSNLECRPGPAYRAITGDRMRRFDDLGCRLVVEGPALSIRTIEGAGLMRTQGLVMLEPPAVPVPAARVAWLLSPAGKPAVPASPVSAWLISVLPDRGAGTGGF